MEIRNIGVSREVLEGRRFAGNCIRMLQEAPLSPPEMLAFVSTIGALRYLRDVPAEEMRAYCEQSHDRLPFEGCERVLFDAVLAALRERGYTSAGITVLLDAAVRAVGIIGIGMWGTNP